MRLWSYEMLRVLPQAQLVSQWRECAAIAKNIKENGTPNHLLVNKILQYSYTEFIEYTALVQDELLRRGYNAQNTVMNRIVQNCHDVAWSGLPYMGIDDQLFAGWHNDRYLRQCYYNLQEKRDCGGISDAEWKLIFNKFQDRGWEE